MSQKKKSAWRENLEAVLIAFVIAMFIRTFIVQAFKIPTGSMLETLQIGDQIFVNKFIYGVKIPFTGGRTLIPVRDPRRNEIVVFKYPEDPSKDFIKRVVAVAGDTLEIVNKKLYVNDTPVTDEPWARHTDSRIFPAQITTRDNMARFTVPPNKLFVMGDNRDNSHDSRFWGFVDLSEVRGEALIIYWSRDKENATIRWHRIGTLLF